MYYNEARQLMVDNQIKPNKVNDKKIIDLFQIIEKELFLPEKKQKHAYIDCEIEIVNNRSYQSNMHIAQLLQAASISKLDKNVKFFYILILYALDLPPAYLNGVFI